MTRGYRAPTVTVFRHIAMEESMAAGYETVVHFFPIWLLMGVIWSFLNTELIGLLAPNGMTLLGKTVLFLSLAVWPMKGGAWVSLRRHQGKKVTPLSVFALRSVLPFTMGVMAVVVLAGLVGMLIDWALTSFVLGASAARPWPFLMGPVSTRGVMRLYPALCLGALFTGHRYIFSPFVALDDDTGFWTALEKARRYAAGVRLEIMFLFGLMFFPASISFLLSAATGGGKFPGDIASHVVFALCCAYAGGVWAQAYRQTVDLENLERGIAPAAERPNHVQL